MKKKCICGFVMIVALLLPLLVQYTAQHSQQALQASLHQTVTKTIIIDAGHGGIDGGTVAVDGTLEKGINLEIARYLNAICMANGISTRMTRTIDESIHDATASTIRQKKVSDIHNRLEIMSETKDGLFVSIHQNHYTREADHGAQVFFSGNDPMSRGLADGIQHSIVKALQPDNTRKVKQSGTEIYLLYHATCPAVMVECGFLSNRAETDSLKNPGYQKEMALSIYNGIEEFIKGESVL